ncbi:MAG: NAD(P)/FAD-dependent oxidoreductase [bacterium]
MKTVDNFDVIIVGGGAAGLFACHLLSSKKVNCAVFEKNQRVGKKLLATGNGKCNLSNKEMCLSNYFGDHLFIKQVLDSSPQKSIFEEFEKIGIDLFINDENKVFPRSMQASSVLDALRFSIEENGGKIICDCEILSIEKKGEVFTLKTSSSVEEFSAKKIIIAVGGISGIERQNKYFFDFIKKMNHTIIEPMPSLVQLKLEGNLHRSMEGNKWFAGASVYDGENLLASDKNEILFTEYGISGNAILNISRYAVESIKRGKKTVLSLDLYPEESLNETKANIERRRKNLKNRKMENFFSGRLNKRIGMALIKSCSIELSRLVETLKDEETELMANVLHDWRFEIKSDNGFPSSQVMAGGVSTDEINALSMESKRVKNIYFVGEIMNVDGKSGGYNLHFAWASAYVAVKAILEEFLVTSK